MDLFLFKKVVISLFTGYSSRNLSLMYEYNALNCGVGSSVAVPELPGAATFRVEPEPIFFLAGAKSRSRLF